MYNNYTAFLNKDAKCAQVNILKAQESLMKILLDFRFTIPRFDLSQITQAPSENMTKGYTITLKSQRTTFNVWKRTSHMYIFYKIVSSSQFILRHLEFFEQSIKSYAQIIINKGIYFRDSFIIPACLICVSNDRLAIFSNKRKIRN